MLSFFDVELAGYKDKIEKASHLFAHQWLKSRKHNLKEGSIYHSIREYQIPINKYVKIYVSSLRGKSHKFYLEVLKKT